MKEYSILYVDDQDMNLFLLSETFSDDYNIYTAISGEEGLKLFKKEKIDLVISDQAMPKMTGVEFFEKIIELNPEPNRILLTAHSNFEAL
nr:response regulator [Bacteroidales bacterium]